MIKGAKEESDYASFLKRALKLFDTGRLFFIIEKHHLKEIDAVIYGVKKLRDKKYAQLRLILSTDIAKEEINKIRTVLKIPEEGFKNKAEYDNWYRNILKLKDDALIKQKSKTKEGTAENTSVGKLHILAREFAADFIGSESEYAEMVEHVILFNNFNYPVPLFGISIKFEKQKPTISINLLPHTRKEDINKYWQQINFIREYFKSSHTRLKDWQMLERDIAIYQLYVEYMEEFGDRSSRKGLPSYYSAAEKYIYAKMKDAYPDINFLNIRKIVSRFKKKAQLGDI